MLSNCTNPCFQHPLKNMCFHRVKHNCASSRMHKCTSRRSTSLLQFLGKHNYPSHENTCVLHAKTLMWFTFLGSTTVFHAKAQLFFVSKNIYATCGSTSVFHFFGSTIVLSPEKYNRASHQSTHTHQIYNRKKHRDQKTTKKLRKN